ncbi:MAG: GNAT family N-acetyltransferase [Bosea sp. (in: a-proteobacteria)]
MSGTPQLLLRGGQEGDVDALADLFDMANHGDIAVIWGKEAGEGETWKHVCTRHMLDPRSEIHIGKAVVAEVDGAVAGMLFFFHLRPSPMMDVSGLPDHARPFAVLRNQVPECVFLRDMAVFPQYRGHRLATRMLDAAIGAGFRSGLKHAVAIVHESNTLLLAHYYKRGLAEVGSHTVLEHNHHSPESRWLLLKLDAPQEAEPVPPAPSPPSS